MKYFPIFSIKLRVHINMKNVKESANFIWSIADLLRGDYKQSDYGKIILPLTVIRRLDCVLESTKAILRRKYTK